MSPAVITGVGVVSAFGVGAARLWDALAAGASAVGPIRSFDATTFPARVAGEAPIVAVTADWLTTEAFPLAPEHAAAVAREARAWEDRGALRDRKVAFALLAALQAWASAGCGPGEQGAWQSIALGLEQALLEDFAPLYSHGEIRWSAEPQASLPAVRFRTRVDLAAELIARVLALKGPRVVHASACAAGTLAVTHAAALIERGAAEIVLCGAADSMINPLGLGGMSRLGVPSPRNQPDACRPFDARRDGLAIGEGAAMFVVENEHRARARGRRPLARVLGWGSTQDAYKATAPRPDGAAAAGAMLRALERARLPAAAIGYINAHGTGTPLNDPAEVRAIRRALGAAAETVPVSSIKGAVGHLMAASGAIELAACLLPLVRGVLPGTAHHEQRDPECDLDIIGPAPRATRVEHVLSNSFGFGGQNASVILGRPS